jgi:lipoyl synthase
MNERLPAWLLKKTPKHFYEKEIRQMLGEEKLHSVCEEAKCPNRGECFKNKTMTFLILGNSCTRSCSFCAVAKEGAAQLDKAEKMKVLEAVKKLTLKHVVITSVTRDDLADGGVGQFKDVVELLKKELPEVTIELLTPDFLGKEQLWSQLLESDFEIFNHNIETVPRLYEKIRPEAEYGRSLKMLQYFKEKSKVKVKTGLMVGLGEADSEVFQVLNDIKDVCELVTIGQYLRPSKQQSEVARYVEPEIFEQYKSYGENLGLQVFAGPWVRSSYQAEQFV